MLVLITQDEKEAFYEVYQYEKIVINWEKCLRLF